MICLAFTKRNLSLSHIPFLSHFPGCIPTVHLICLFFQKSMSVKGAAPVQSRKKTRGKGNMSDNKNKRRQNIILALVSVSLCFPLFSGFLVTWGNVLPRTERWGQFCLHSLSLPFSFSIYQVFFILSIHSIVFSVPSQPDLWLFCPFRGIVVPKLNILSYFTHPHALPNLWRLLCNTKEERFFFKCTDRSMQLQKGRHFQG